MAPDRKDGRKRSSFSSVVSIGTSALAVYGAYQLASLAYNAWNESQDDRRRHHHSSARSASSTNTNGRFRGRVTNNSRRNELRQCRDQVREVLYRLVPGVMKSMVNEATDFQRARQELKEMRSGDRQHDRFEELELWRTIQSQSISRLVVTTYAPSILFVVLTVQVSVILGKKKNHEVSGDTTNSEFYGEDNQLDQGEMSDYRWILEQTYQYMFQHGLPALLESVKRIVNDVIPEDWNVLDPSTLHFSSSQLQDVLRQVHMRLCDNGTLGRERSLLRFAQPPSVLMEDEGEDEGTEDVRRRMNLLDETWDILESPMVQDALLDSLYTLQRTLVHDVFYTPAEDAGEEEYRSTASGRLPLAQVLTRVKKECLQFYTAFTLREDQEFNDEQQDVNKYILSLERLPSITEVMDVSFD